jgi:hypothetical protein
MKQYSVFFKSFSRRPVEKPADKFLQYPTKYQTGMNTKKIRNRTHLNQQIPPHNICYERFPENIEDMSTTSQKKKKKKKASK